MKKLMKWKKSKILFLIEDQYINLINEVNEVKSLNNKAF